MWNDNFANISRAFSVKLHWDAGNLESTLVHALAWYRISHYPSQCWRRSMLPMMTSSNGNISALLALCAGNSPVSGEFPAQRPVTRSFDVFFDLRLIKRLSKHSRGWWFETLSHPLWRHRNDIASPAHNGCMESSDKNGFVQSMYGDE